MKNFLLDSEGDVVIQKGNIQMVEGNALKAQTIRQVIGTNLGEWLKDENEGIDFSVILARHPNPELILDAVTTAIKQVDENLEVIDFACQKEKNRTLKITFTAVNEKTGDRIPVVM